MKRAQALRLPEVFKISIDNCLDINPNHNVIPMIH
jgi:hypothetical protein